MRMPADPILPPIAPNRPRLPAPVPSPPVAPAAPVKLGVTLDEFAKTFVPAPGTYEITFIHTEHEEGGRCRVHPARHPAEKFEVHKRSIEFHYPKREVEINFRLGGRSMSATKISPGEARAWMNAAEVAALLAAAELERWRGRFTAREKGPADLVSEADLAAQAAIRDSLLGLFPDFGFMGEEDVADGSHPYTIDAGGPPTWVVDPLDGTSNYVHDVPAYCVSIGLVYGGEPVVGVIHDPRMGETFAAAQGLGATLNGRPTRVRDNPQLAAAMLATGFSPDFKRQAKSLAMWTRFSSMTRALRRTGSTALNLAYVAAGRYDGYWAFDNFAWDVAAGACLIREAGGVVTDTEGGPFDPLKPDMCTANAGLHGLMLGEISQLDL
jgi:myo-inositol-1(or 4)-monophosphatase